MLATVIEHHAEEAAMLYLVRKRLLRAPHVKLRDLRRSDNRIAAHLDGLAVAGDGAWSVLESSLESGFEGAVFAFTVRALEDDARSRLERVLLLAERSPQWRGELLAAFGWVKPERLRGIVVGLIRSQEDFPRFVGISACALHRVDPGVVAHVQDPLALPRARVFRMAGEIGRCELVSLLSRAITDEDGLCRFWAAHSAVLLGDRHNALEYLREAISTSSPLQARALQLALAAMPLNETHAVLRQVIQDPAKLRTAMRATGIAGNPYYIPWLLSYMADDRFARLAGESFTLITGLDLVGPEFERPRPRDFDAGPSDDPDDPNISMDEDDGLPWPDSERVAAWWNAHSGRFAPGVRHFMGEPLQSEICARVLKDGYQRQRVAAALYLSLLNPGTPLFEWRAPAWRQQRLLAS